MPTPIPTPSQTFLFSGGAEFSVQECIVRAAVRLVQSEKYYRSNLTPYSPRRRILTHVCNDSPDTRLALSATLWGLSWGHADVHYTDLIRNNRID